ncbi:hypothetical protein NMG60_11014571 [Bertholletia excelsa]
MLMEEDDLESKPCMFQECLALQATEKSFYDVIGEKYPPSLNARPLLDLERSAERPDGGSTGACSSESNGSVRCGNGRVNYLGSSSQVSDSSNQSQTLWLFREGKTKVSELSLNKDCVNHDWELGPRERIADGSREKRNHGREDGESGRSNKQLASYGQESDEKLEMYDKLLLCSRLDPGLPRHKPSFCQYNGASQDEKGLKSSHQKGPPRGPNGAKLRGKKQGQKKEVVDLRPLLCQCAQAIAAVDTRSANELLVQIKQNSSPYGDGTERMAHYLAYALEARLAGTGTELYSALSCQNVSAADTLRGYQAYVKACPFNKMSNTLANRSIEKLAERGTRLHIIDFGILYGFQWPCLIQHLSVRPGGPPRLHITGIDFPQPGFRPAERLEETGRRLATYCERFNVPFEYTAIAKKWADITLDDLKIDQDEVLIVNCLYRLQNIPDETVVAASPRDALLNLLKRVNPEMFIHGVVNGTYNAPFFAWRFREALFHFSAVFDMLETTVAREDEDRLLFERGAFGRELINVIACEGIERVVRPETYKRWQVRTVRAGFTQLPLDQEIVRDVKAVVKMHCHKDFVVDEDTNWILQGWKGRIILALSCWKPVQEY